MKNYLASLCILLLSFSYQSIKAQMIARDGFQEGYKAIQFGIGNNFQLSTFDGSALSLKKYISETKARFVRFSFNTDYENENYDREISRTNPNDETQSDISNSESSDLSTNLRATIGTHSYIKTESDVLPFISRNLFFGTYINKGKADNTSNSQSGNNTNSRTDDVENTRFRPFLGIGLGIGVDYFIAKNISLTASTGFEVQYLHENMSTSTNREITNSTGLTSIDVESNDRTSHRFILQSSGVLFGINAYF